MENYEIIKWKSAEYWCTVFFTISPHSTHPLALSSWAFNFRFSNWSSKICDWLWASSWAISEDSLREPFIPSRLVRGDANSLMECISRSSSAHFWRLARRSRSSRPFSRSNSSTRSRVWKWQSNNILKSLKNALLSYPAEEICCWPALQSA